MLSTISLLTYNLQVELKFKDYSSLGELQWFYFLKFTKYNSYTWLLSHQ